VALSCGDGVRTPDEACDDGNSTDDDGCSTCVVDEGYRCSASGCSAICGDGLIRGGEECDDENRVSADGCSAACIEEPYQACTGEPSDCESTIVCGNHVVEPGEVCDPPEDQVATTTCVLPGDPAGIPCKQFDTGKIDLAICNNGVIELGEECDGDGGTGGCDANCEIEDGYACPAADYCYLVPSCGDNIVQAGEECDVGAVNSTPCDNCQVQPNWYCSGSPSLCVASLCGDGNVAPDEQCDDGGTGTGDGCNGSCQVETGWVCPPGINCIPVCGNGVRQGTEQCDVTSPGCVNCQVQPGYDCGVDGITACAPSVCGNGIQENGEGCDNGGLCSDDHAVVCTSDSDCGGTCLLIAGDGCGPTCQVEPAVTVGPNPTVAITCGDGMRTGAEEDPGRCDDGNTQSGDGCSYPGCVEEPGWTCTDQLDLPGTVNLKIKYRDFKGRFTPVNSNSTAQAGGHPHFGQYNQSPILGQTLKQITGPLCTPANQTSCGRLDTEGKPLLEITPVSPGAMPDNPDAFYLWYRSENLGGYPDPMDGPLQWGGDDIEVFDAGENDFVTLTQSMTNPEAYVFQDTTFFPLDQRGFGDTVGQTENFHFTSEIRYFFRYERGQELQFYGDDDVWVYVNGRLAVDIGGIHGQENGRVILGDQNASCSVTGTGACALSMAEQSDNTDDRFDITVDNLYEIVVFQAERSPFDSYYKLTLDDFLAPRSACATDCGDGIRAGNEICDDPSGNVDGVYGQCDTSCTFTFCGDGIPQPEEECDNGLNVDTYGVGSGLCAPGCNLPGNCGDNILQPSNEVCDDGVNDGGYGECLNCTSISYCGDGVVNGPEVCEKDNFTQGGQAQGGTANPGESFVNYQSGLNDCGFNCQLAPFCGDGVRNGAEHCERFVTGEPEDVYCDADTCTYEPYCGDGLVDAGTGEQCDYGVDFGFDGDPEDAPFGGCTLSCELGPFCGDGSQHEFEECDFGEASNDGEYDGCTDTCTLGPRCGDGELQSTQGEECDNGFNDDTYAYVDDACGPDCSDVPYCGDGSIQATFELCDAGDDNDDATYDGCTTVCDWGPYCGDGTVQTGFEQCDLGIDNASYSATGEGCGYDCQPAPYCGDGERNGPEQCDLGTEDNDGEYGSCKANCTKAPYCGDGIVQSGEGEHCDDGPTGSLSCSVTCRNRPVIK
jgi:fibro-slime domain-containing protein